jgi:hypothetical protein
MSASCIESTEDALQAHVSQQHRRPLSAGACNSTFENPAADLAQRSQCSSSTRWYKGRNQVPRRGARPVLERMSADACRHPHTRAVNRVGARLLRYLWRGWPHLESGGFRFSRVVSRHILWLEGWTTDSHEKEGTICLVHAMLGEVEDGRRSTSRSILA